MAAAIDGFAWARASAPRLSSAAQLIEAVGCDAARCLLLRISGEATGLRCVITLQPRLIVRDSCRSFA